MDDAAVVPTLQLRVPDARSPDLFLAGPETLVVDSTPRIVDELLALAP